MLPSARAPRLSPDPASGRATPEAGQQGVGQAGLPVRQPGPPFSVLVLADPESPIAAAVDSALRQVGATDVRLTASPSDLIRRMPHPVETGVGVLSLSPRAEAVAPLVAALRSRGWRRIIIVTEDGDDAAIRLAIASKIRCLIHRPRLASAPPAEQVSAARLSDLSSREIQVLQAVADGHTNNQIGTRLGLSGLTVKSHLARIGRKTGTGDRAEMVAMAMRAGLVV